MPAFAGRTLLITILVMVGPGHILIAGKPFRSK